MTKEKHRGLRSFPLPRKFFVQFKAVVHNRKQNSDQEGNKEPKKKEQTTKTRAKGKIK